MTSTSCRLPCGRSTAPGLISRAFREHRTHFILSAITKSDRYFSTAAADRRLPVVDVNGRLPAQDEGMLRDLGMPEALLVEVSNLLFVGLGMHGAPGS